MSEESSPKTWRLIHTPPAAGAWNMALDEAILEAIGRGESPTTLRFYAWEPPCLSLGHNQPIADVDRARLVTRGWQLVRRPTGGRAILHADELTYAVIGPYSDPILTGGVLDSYQRLAQAILAALQTLHLSAEALPHPTQPTDKKKQEPVCFEVPSNYEITVNGKKLVGSAQARKVIGVLQHGTLPLHGDITRITQALSFPDEAARARAARRVLERAATVEASTGKIVSWQAAAEAFRAAFETTLKLALTPGEITPAELERAEALVKEKYAHPGWTERI